MKRYLEIKGKILMQRYNSNSWSIELEVIPNDIIPFFMELQLLENRHIDTITVKSIKSPDYVTLFLSQPGEKSRIDQINGKYEIHLTNINIEVISSYILKYYRDSYAPVDHLDIELSHDGKLGKDATLIIRASDIVQPMSGKEAKKLLGIE